MSTENDKVNTGALGTLVVVGVFATLTIALSVTALVRYSVQGVVDQRQTLVQQEYRELRQSQTDKIGSTPVWTDKGKGLVSIPIDRAKMKVLADLARDPASASPPAPAPSAPPTAETAELGQGSTDAGVSAEANAAQEAATKAALAPSTALLGAKDAKGPAPKPPHASAVVTPAPAPAPKPTDG